MQYRILGKTDWKVSAVSMGCWALGGQFGNVEEKDAIATVHAALDAGCNFFDTAEAYGTIPGTSEFIVGKALKEKRDKAFIATKVGNWGGRQGLKMTEHPMAIINRCHSSLYRLQTDYIDLYQCHIQNPDKPDIWIEAFEKLKEEGKIRAYGISSDNISSVKTFNITENLSVVQTGYNIIDRKAEKELFPYCLENNIGVILKDPLRKGLLTGKFNKDTIFDDQVRSRRWNPDRRGREEFLKGLELVGALRCFEKSDRSLVDIALQFTLSQPAVTCPIPGMKTVKQAKQNCAAADSNLTEEEIEQIKELADKYKSLK